MKKLFLSASLLLLLTAVFIPVLATAAGNPTAGQAFVPCGNTGQAACTICDFFKMLMIIYNFIVWDIATPLAIIALAVGGILMMISAGNPNLMSKGKTIFWTAVIGLVLVFCSYLIIATILNIIGYTASWASLKINCN